MLVRDIPPIQICLENTSKSEWFSASEIFDKQKTYVIPNTFPKIDIAPSK